MTLNTSRITMQDALYSSTPFYNQSDYIDSSRADFSQDHPSYSDDYVWDSEGVICRGAFNSIS